MDAYNTMGSFISVASQIDR